MANASAAATVWNCPNYLGELFLIGQTQTPFLNMIGGLDGSRAKVTRSFRFPVAQPWNLEAASQPAITETASLTAPTPTTYVRSEDTNSVQLFQEQVSVSYMKQAVSGEISGLSVLGFNQPVGNEKDFQIMANLRQIALDVEYTFLNGAYQAAVNAGVAGKTRGIITAATTNTVNASSAALSKSLIDQLLRTMAGNGSQFMNPIIFCNAFQKQKLTNVYGYAPESRTEGGLAIERIMTDFAIIPIVYAPQVPAATILVADISVVAPVFLPVPDKGVLFYEELSKTGGAESGQIYGLIGLDYGPEEYHGTITSLATS